MINNLVLAGKVVELPKLKETPNGTKYATIILEVTRSFRNCNSQYDSDRIVVNLWKGVAELACDVCKLGDILGIRGQVQSYVDDTKNQELRYEIVAEQVSFLD